ncbi:hypothetical protein WMY93_009968 [Mugilogobius chulae]|uniref:Ribosomal L1 domain-containing protein 1 n=1 Tax=Mugilogobius chulae TaxID=88201 RepID=A0AAW0PGF5_9GOBI
MGHLCQRLTALVIPFTTLKKEYKPYEAKRRLLGNFDVFLSDDRIRRLLPSHIGKHFYERKKEPLCVDLQSKNLARDIQRLVQGTNLKHGSVAHSGMTADEVTDNIETTFQTIMAKMQTKGPLIKIIHLKSQNSVALPIYTSDLSHLTLIEEVKRNTKSQKKNKTEGKQIDSKKLKDEKNKAAPQQDKEEDDEEEEIPQLVPIETPTKKPKLEKTLKKKTLEKAPKTAVAQKTKTAVKLGKKSDTKYNQASGQPKKGDASQVGWVFCGSSKPAQRRKLTRDMDDAGDSFEDGRQTLFLDDEYSEDSPGCAYLHKPVIAMVMGSLMSAAGALLLLLHVSQVGSACLSIGLMFVMVGLVWIPVLKEKHRRKRCALGE